MLVHVNQNHITIALTHELKQIKLTKEDIKLLMQTSDFGIEHDFSIQDNILHSDLGKFSISNTNLLQLQTKYITSLKLIS